MWIGRYGQELTFLKRMFSSVVPMSYLPILRIRPVALCIISGLWFLSSCTGFGGSGDTTPEIEQQTFYQREIQPIFNGSCAGSGCHIGGNAGNVRLDWYSRTMESVGSTLGRTVLPRNPDESPLIRVVSGPVAGLPLMPIGNPRLTDEQIEKLRQWIQNDALED